MQDGTTARRPMTYLVGEMSNGAAKLADTYPRGIGRCFVERPIAPFPGEPWALDNGVFRAWNAAGRDPSIDYAEAYAQFESRLPLAAELAREGRGPMFIVAPDRPADPSSIFESLAWVAEYELEEQEELDPMGWYHGAAAASLPIYLAVQDGMDPQAIEELVDVETDEPVLSKFSGLFLGGTDDFKRDTLAAWRELADRWGIALHYGRCTQSKLADAVAAGCDSADSSHPIRLAGARWERFLEVFDEVVGSQDDPEPEPELADGACPHCGSTDEPDFFEVWGDGSYMIEYCCEEAELAAQEADDETRLAEANELAELHGYRRAYDSERDWRHRIDFGLSIRTISRGDAKAFIREHHRHNPPPAGDRFRFGCFNGSELVAVMMAGRPVARMIDHETVVEVNRLCVNHDLDRELTWKACSMLYTAAVKEAGRRGFEKVITYTLEEEEGMSLRYARFKPVATTKGGSWNRPSRKRTDKAPTCRKVRWERRAVA